MKKTLFKIAAAMLVGAVIVTAPALVRGADDAAKGATGATKDQPAPEKFYGPVTAVDTKAMTFTVGDQTFTVTSKSQLTKSDKTATLADAVVGEPARGSYTKGKDGKLEITKVRFGKKPAAGKTNGKTGGKAGGEKAQKSGDADSGATTTK
jgi:hypothetical protein